MKDELRHLAREHVLRGKEKTKRALTMLRMYRRDPEANRFLQDAMDPMLRSVSYHLRQAAVLEATARQLPRWPSASAREIE